MSFNPGQIEQLQAKLNGSAVKSRKQAGRELSYIEGWHAIDEANRIFGYDAWDRELVTVKESSRELVELQSDRGPYKQWRVSYIATVRIIVYAGTDRIVKRDGTGYGSGMGKPEALGDAIESAIKEAETDAMKRALMTFGNPFGLALYDKTQENVEKAAPPSRPTPDPEYLARNPTPPDRRPAPAAPPRKAGGIADRAAPPRVTSGPLPASDDNPFAPTDEEVAAYTARFQSNVEACQTVGEVDTLWKAEVHERFRLGIGKTGPNFARLASIADRRATVIQNQVVDRLRA
jgi:DNA recombination protein Rad52